MRSPLGAREDNSELLLAAFGLKQYPRFSSDPFCLKDFSTDTLRKNVPRLAVCVLFTSVCVYTNNLGQAWLQKYMTGFYEAEWGYSNEDFADGQAWLKRHQPSIYKARWGNTPRDEANFGVTENMHHIYQNKTVILYDLAFLFLPEAPVSFVEWFDFVSIWTCIGRYVIVPGPLSMRWTFAQRMFIVQGMVWLLRAFTIVLTPLPNPFPECKAVITFPNNRWLEAFANMPMIKNIWHEVTCQDVLFSGHTMVGTLFTFFSWRYLSTSPWFRPSRHSASMKLFTDVGCSLWLVFGWWAIAASRFHYAVDVFVGAVLSFFAYNAYHSLIYSIWFWDPRSTQSFFAQLIIWLERDAIDIKLWRMQVAKTLHAGATDMQDELRLATLLRRHKGGDVAMAPVQDSRTESIASPLETLESLGDTLWGALDGRVSVADSEETAKQEEELLWAGSPRRNSHDNHDRILCPCCGKQMQ